MFKEMRRKDRELNDETVENILLKGEYGTIATAGVNGYPYCIPLSYVYVNGFIYFHSAVEGSKVDCFNNDDRVCFTVVGQTKVLPEKFSTIYESVVAFGKIVEINGDEKQAALEEIISKYSPEFLKEGLEYVGRAKDKTKVFKIVIENVKGKGRQM